MASKTDVIARAEGKIKRKYFGSCGHEVYPVLVSGMRGSSLMGWHCDSCGKRVKKVCWVTGKVGAAQ